MSTCAGVGHSMWELEKTNKALYDAVPEVIRDSDWFEAFGYAPFAITDVVEVCYLVDGQNDEDSWVGVFKLKNGNFGYLTAGCDYTGWDCQAGGNGDTRATLEEVIRDLVGEDDRVRMGLPKVAPALT